MEKKNEKSNLTQEQMEKAAGGGILPESDINHLNPMPNYAMDSFMCPGKGCGKALQCVGGKMYRCVNPLCPLFAIDQFPAGQ